ncbi:MAG: hypothetical protein ACRDZ8_13435 [Acidimicrobiales bacterium]
MSTLWTPSGERPIRRESPPSAPTPPSPPSGGDRPPGGRRPPDGPNDRELTAEDEAALAELQEQLAHTPAELVIANHAFGLFELAALHLSADQPRLPPARLAIDALGALVEGMEGRLGEYEQQLHDGLANLRMAFVQIRGAAEATPPQG